MIASIISVLIFIVCILLMLVVLVQNPKGGGLATGFGGAANQMMGARRSTDVMEKATWIMAAALLVLSVASSSGLGKGGEQPTGPASTSTTQGKVNNFQPKGLPANALSPVAPTGNPGQAPPAATQPAVNTQPAPAGKGPQ
ncbi:MAG: protein translocase subunit SecG [Bacteroidetes bacterium]|nr:MAG: protein translocase subunit SecG [Bacteroidota bacterium]